MYTREELLNGVPLEESEVEMLQGLKDTLQENKALQGAIRNGVFLPLLKDGIYQRASEVLDILLTHASEDVALIRDKASLCLKMGDKQIAGEFLSQALSKGGNDTGLITQSIQTHLLTKNVEEAADIAERFLPDVSDDMRQRLMMMKALYRADRPLPAIQAALALVDWELRHTADLENIASAAGVLTSYNKIDKAIEALSRLDIINSTSQRARFELARALFLKNDKDVEVEALIIDYSSEGNLAKRCLDLIIRSKLARADLEGAEKMLAQVPFDQQARTLLLQLSRSYRENGDLEKALAITENLYTHDSSRAPIMRQYASLLQEAGEAEKAKNVYLSWLKKCDEQLPQSFSEGVDQIFSSQNRTSVPLSRIEWIEDKLAENGVRVGDRDEFATSLCNITKFDDFLLKWIECRASQVDDVLPFFKGIEQTANDLNEALKLKRGVFVACAHIGVLWGGPVTISTANLPGLCLTSAPDLGDERSERILVSFSGGDSKKVVRQLLRSLRDNKIVSIAVDGNASLGKVKRSLFDREIAISDFVPRMSWKNSVPSFFPFLIWNEGKVNVSLKALPQPFSGELLEEFCSRWCDVYVEYIHEMFITHPRSLRGTGGFWTNLHG